MPPPGEGSSPRNVVEVGLKISRQKIEEHLSYKPNEETRRKHNKLQLRLAAISRRERKLRQAEAADDFLEEKLGELDGMERETYEETVSLAISDILASDSDVEKQEELRFQLIHGLFSPKVFTEKRKEWEAEYEEKGRESSFELSFEEFVLEKGLEFIKLNRDLIIQERVFHHLDEIGDKKSDSEEEEKRRKEIGDEVVKFVAANEKKILNEEADLDLLRAKFVKIFLERGHTEDEKEGIEELFAQIVGDIEYAVVIQKKFELTYEKLVEMSYLNLTDEEWEKGIQQAIQENAEGKVKEAIEEMVKPTFTPTAAVDAPTATYSSVREIGNASGVHIRRVKIAGQEGRNLYMIDFPYLGASHRPLMEITFPEGTTDLNQATYSIEDPFGNLDAGNTGRPLRMNRRTLEYKAGSLPEVMARIQLDYALYKAARESGNGALTPEYVNKVIPDDRLSKMSERLLKMSFREDRLIPPRMVRYENFLKVLMLPDDKIGGFPERVKAMETALRKDSLVQQLREILDRSGSTIMNVSDLLEQAELKRGGVEVGK